MKGASKIKWFKIPFCCAIDNNAMCTSLQYMYAFVCEVKQLEYHVTQIKVIDDTEEFYCLY